MEQEEKLRAGVCENCLHVRKLETKIGATIYMCRLSAKDQHFPKFPPLPMLACPGFEKSDPES